MPADLELFEARLAAEGKSYNTVAAYSKDVQHFKAFLSEKLPGAFEGFDFAPVYLNELKDTHSAATIRRRATALRSYFRLMHDTTILDHYKAPPAPPGKAHPLPNLMDDVRAMLKVCRPKHRLAIALCGFAGLRIAEASDLQWSDVEDDVIEVLGKGSKVRYVPVAPELRAIMDETPPQYRLGHMVRLGDRGIRNAITRAGEKAGLDRPVASHDLRMTFGTVVYDKTKDLRVVQELLGHADPETTARYTGITEDRKREAVLAALP